MIKIVLHHTCKSSYTLFKALKDTPGVKFEMATQPYFTYVKNYVLSVPAVFKDEELYLLDPVEPGDVKALIEGRVEKELDIDEAVDNVIRGVMASQAILTAVMLHKSLKPVLDAEIISVLSRAKFHRQAGKVPQIIQRIKEREEELLKEHWEHLVKLLTFGLVREMYWLQIDIDEVEKSHVKMWLLAKATIGRLGLPYPKPDVPDDVAEAIYSVLKEAGRRYMDRVVEEQQMILSDEEFMALPRA